LGKAAIRWLKDFISPHGLYPEDLINPGSPEVGAYSIFPRVFFDEVLKNYHSSIWVNEGGTVFDIAGINQKFARLKRKAERENKRVLKLNGYEGTAHSEVFARFNVIKKQARHLKKLVETFTNLYGSLFPQANFYLTNTWAGSGYNYHPSFGDYRSVGPGERRLPQARLILYQALPVPTSEKISVIFTQGKVYVSSDLRKDKKNLNLDNPKSVLIRLKEFGLPVSGHDAARVLEAAIKSAREKKRCNKRGRKGSI
jgi:hypothetical protein